MRRAVNSAILVAFIAGCAVGPKYTPPDPSVPQQWHAPAAGGATLAPAELTEWWHVFSDPQLNALIDEATTSNLDLRIAEARVREARAARGIVAADLYPQVGVSGTYQRSETTQPDLNNDPSVSFGGNANAQSFSRSATLRAGDFTGTSTTSAQRLGGLLLGAANGQPITLDSIRPSNSRTLAYTPGSSVGFDRTQDFYQVGFDASWELDIFGRTRRAVEAADASIAAADENRRDVLVSLLAEVARNYLTLREAQARIDIAHENIVAQQRSVDITRARFEAGLTSELDVTRAEAQLAATQSQVPALESIAQATIHRLSVLLGKNPADLHDQLISGKPLPPTPPDVPVGIPSDILRRRADVRRAERELAAATARIGVATADLFPRFSLTGNLGTQSSTLGGLNLGANRFWGFGPSVSWPVFDAGRIRANIRVENARTEQALAFYERSVKESLEDTETSLVAYAKEQERLVSLDKAVAAEKRAVTLANERYVTGLTDFVNVLDAQRTLYSAQDQQVQSRTTVLLNLVALYKALGGGWETFEPAQDSTPAATPQGQG